MAVVTDLPIPEAPNPDNPLPSTNPEYHPDNVLVLPVTPTAPPKPGLRFPLVGNAILVIDSTGIYIDLDSFKLR